MGLSPSRVPENDAALHTDDVVPNLPASENKRFYPALDGLRAIAVLMVFYQHYLSFEGTRPALNWGWTGVDIFFVLSGFLITGILYDTRNTLHRFRNFYVRRTLRIFPLYYGVLLIGLLLTPIFRWIWHPVWILWPLYLGNYGRFIWLNDWMQGTGVLDHLRSSLPFDPPFLLYFGHFWSLCVEEQFYLVWPLLVFLIKDRVRLRNLCIAVCIFCLIARILCAWLLPQNYIDAEFLYRFTPLRADALLLGGALALMLRGPEAARLKRLLRPALSLFVAGFVLFEVLYRHAIHHFYSPVAGAPVLDTLGYTLIDLFAGILILLALAPGGILYRVLTIRQLRRLGQISYGFYVFHDIPHLAYGLLIDRIFPNVSDAASCNLTAAVALTGTLVLSYLSYRFFEAPFLRLKDCFTA
jgi:peptidoglycan/LPS O-acetylase OafA/YrhL